MPARVVEAVFRALETAAAIKPEGARLLLIGVAYKKNVGDIRESPALALIELLEAQGAEVEFHDPHIAAIPATRDHGALAGRKSVGLDAETVARFDAPLICTDHDGIDYAALVRASALIIDTRNATRDVTEGREKIVKA